MCEFHGSNSNGLRDMWWTDKFIYFSIIDVRKARLHQPPFCLSQVRRLSQLPTGGSQHSESDTDLARDYQVAQLKIDNLERQKADLVNELQLMRDRSSHSSEHTDTVISALNKKITLMFFFNLFLHLNILLLIK